MAIVSLPGKYVPIKNYKIYTATLDPKVDPDTMQPIGERLAYQYKVIMDKFNNVYILPMKDGKTMFSMSDIVEAASGNEEKMIKIESARETLIDTYNADLLGQEWMDYFYKELTNEATNKTVLKELEEDTKKRLHETVKMPDHVSSYEELSKNQNQVAALAATACYPEKGMRKAPTIAPKDTPKEQ